MPIRRPELPPVLSAGEIPAAEDGVVTIAALAIDGDDSQPVVARQLHVDEAELTGVTVAAGRLEGIGGLGLTDTILSNCDLSNVDGHEGTLRRVAITRSRLVGFGLSEGAAKDLTVRDSVLTLARFGFSELRDVLFERVNLSEASFIDARLENVSFVDCKLVGADFRGAAFKDCAIRGSSLNGVLGVSSLRGISMPWPDVLESAAALAGALGIEVEDA